MLRQLHIRLKALEARMPDPTKPRKSLLPDWLRAAMLEQGVVFDEFDRPHWAAQPAEKTNR